MVPGPTAHRCSPGYSCAGGRALIGVLELPTPVQFEMNEAERVNSFRGEAWLNSSALSSSRADAIDSLELGLQRDRTFVPLLIDLMDHQRDAGLAPLEAALDRYPGKQALLDLALDWATRGARTHRASSMAAVADRDATVTYFCGVERVMGSP